HPAEGACNARLPGRHARRHLRAGHADSRRELPEVEGAAPSRRRRAPDPRRSPAGADRAVTTMTAMTPNSWTGYAPLDAGVRAQFQAAINDIREGLRRWRSWSYLSVENVKNRYRRTVLGPWWLTLQMGIFV